MPGIWSGADVAYRCAIARIFPSPAHYRAAFPFPLPAGAALRPSKVTAAPRPGAARAARPSLRLLTGNEFDLAGKTRFSLCRCGGSVKKPFCDGTHSRL